jgi:hypothetical protein
VSDLQEDPAPPSEKLQRTRRISFKEKSDGPYVNGPGDMLIENNINTVEQFNQHTDKLDAVSSLLSSTLQSSLVIT